MSTNWANKPEIIDKAGIEELVRIHGPFSGLRRLDDPLKHPMDNLETSVYTFQDGTSITLEVNPTTGQARVVDYGGVGEAIDTQVKAQAKNDQFEIKQIGQELFQIYGDGRVKKIMDVPLSEYEKAQIQSMQSKQAGVYDNYQQTITFLEGEIAAGRMTPADASRALARSRDAALKGATPLEMDQLAQGNAQIGAGMLNQRVSSGTSMANSLVDYMGQAAQRMLPGDGFDPHSWNPWALSKNFVTDLGGGPGVYGTAASLVNNLQQMGQPQSDPTMPAYWLEGGDPGIPEEVTSRGTYGAQPPQSAPPYMPNDPSTWWNSNTPIPGGR